MKSRVLGFIKTVLQKISSLTSEFFFEIGTDSPQYLGIIIQLYKLVKFLNLEIIALLSIS